jgi:hypothetical protein
VGGDDKDRAKTNESENRAGLKEMKATESEANQEQMEAVENNYNRAYCPAGPGFRWTKNP